MAVELRRISPFSAPDLAGFMPEILAPLSLADYWEKQKLRDKHDRQRPSAKNFLPRTRKIKFRRKNVRRL
jgi:hypothetical protein